MFDFIYDEKNKIWNSTGVPSIFNYNISIGHIILRSLKLNGSKMAQISDDTGERFTFEELRLKTIRAAQNLHARGYKLGEVFGLVSENTAYLPPIVFAALCLGCPVNPMYTGVDRPSLIRMFEMTEPSIVFCDFKAYDLVADCLMQLKNKAKVFTFNGTKGDSEPAELLFEPTGIEEEFVPTEIDGINHIAAIMSSSGTTGECKGIDVSHATVMSSLSNVCMLNADDIMLDLNSLHWSTGFWFLLLATLSGSTRLMTTDEFSPETQLRLIEQYKVTFVFTKACYVVDILKSGLISGRNLSSVKHMMYGGAKVPLHIKKEFSDYLPNGSVTAGYGLTEMIGGISVEFPDLTGKDTAGRILNGYLIKVIDDDGNRCGIDVNGEICVKSRHKLLGYHKNEQLSESAIDSEGFFLTGDIGSIDKDGYVCINGRKKDVIYYDEWVFPSKIEDFLIKSPDISGVCVVGVPLDEVKELPTAIVVRANNSTITEEEIFQMVADNMIDDYKFRGGVYFVDSLPTNQSGKLLRRKVKEMAIELYEAKQRKVNIEGV